MNAHIADPNVFETKPSIYDPARFTLYVDREVLDVMAAIAAKTQCEFCVFFPVHVDARRGKYPVSAHIGGSGYIIPEQVATVASVRRTGPPPPPGTWALFHKHPPRLSFMSATDEDMATNYFVTGVYEPGAGAISDAIVNLPMGDVILSFHVPQNRIVVVYDFPDVDVTNIREEIGYPADWSDSIFPRWSPGGGLGGRRT